MTSESEPAAEPLSAAPALTYPGAPEALIGLWMARRNRMSFGPGESLPPADADLAPLLAARIAPPGPPLGGAQSLHAQKLHDIRKSLVGQPELAALNGILIAHLRKAGFPREAPILFRRIWAEHGAALMPDLPGRWLISSVITFGDHGETEAQRRIGLAANVFFSLMKLYEFERFHSGLDPERPFPVRRVKRRRLPLGMPNFALIGGGLDVNLLASLWNEARQEPVVGPLACHLLDRLNADPATLFRRIGLMRVAKRQARLARQQASRVASGAPARDAGDHDGDETMPADGPPALP